MQNLFPERAIFKINPWCNPNYLGLKFKVSTKKTLFIHRSIVTRICLPLTTFGICKNIISLCKMMVVSKVACFDTYDGKQLKSPKQINVSALAWIKACCGLLDFEDFLAHISVRNTRLSSSIFTFLTSI